MKYLQMYFKGLMKLHFPYICYFVSLFYLFLVIWISNMYIRMPSSLQIQYQPLKESSFNLLKWNLWLFKCVFITLTWLTLVTEYESML